MRINYTTLYIVEKPSESATDFLGSIQKRSEEILDDNEELINKTVFDESNTYEELLKFG